MNIAIALLYSSLLISIAIIDIKSRLILDKIVYPTMAIVLLLAIVNPEIKAWNSLLGGIIGLGLMLAFVVATGGNGMGIGDVKLGALIGLMVGFPDIIYVVAGSWVIGMALFFLRNKEEHQMPFAPAMVVATITTFTITILAIGVWF